MKPRTRHEKKTPQQLQILEDMMVGWGSAHQASIETAMERIGPQVEVSYFNFVMTYCFKTKNIVSGPRKAKVQAQEKMVVDSSSGDVLTVDYIM